MELEQELENVKTLKTKLGTILFFLGVFVIKDLTIV